MRMWPWAGIVIRLILPAFGLPGAMMVYSAEPARGEEARHQIRLAWGGGASRRWQGEVRVDQGSFERLTLLGMEADEPGSIWIEQPEQILVRQRSGRTYDAFDVWLTAESQATLTIELSDPAAPQTPAKISIPLESLLAGPQTHSLDEQGNRLLASRTPGERLRVVANRDSLVFTPGEVFRFAVLPQLGRRGEASTVQLDMQLLAEDDSPPAWSQVREVQLTEPAREIPVSLDIPAGEGVYELVLTASLRTRRRLVPVVASRIIARRTVQLVVIGTEGARRPARKEASWQTVIEIDPANPGWWKRMMQWPQWKLIPAWRPGPQRSGHAQPFAWDGRSLTSLPVEPPVGQATPWEAYPLLVEQPGRPHLLEVEYPSNVPQQLGVSIVEPNGAGEVLPIGIDSGVYLPQAAERQESRLLRHRIPFWPKTRTPFVLLTAPGPRDAVFGKLRVLRGGRRLPRSGATDGFDQRLAALYLGRPLLPESFSAAGVVDPSLSQELDDWEAFYRSGRRLVDYLGYAGYNAAVLSVLSDGSTLYPSDRLQPTPRYDTGMLGTEGRDPQRKDVLEMLFRLFDRESLSLVPALQFAAPLPELEERIRNAESQNTGVELVGPDGGTWLRHRPAVRGLAPYYNPLNEHVQREMLAVVRELAERYAGHPSFGGLALQLTADGYAALPGPQWGVDDATIEQFSRDTQIELPGSGPQRFARRSRLLLGEHRDAWLNWRARNLAGFYRRVQAELAAVQPGAKLYLCAQRMFESPLARQRLRPALPARDSVEELLLESGLDPKLLGEESNIVFLRPQLVETSHFRAELAFSAGLGREGELDRDLAGRRWRGALLYHAPHRLRLPEFDRQGPFGPEQTFTLLVAQPLPSGLWNRRRFVRSLARLDADVLFDGGWLVPFGQEDAMRSLLVTYRQLPPLGFETSDVSGQPLTVRKRSSAMQTDLYMVNDSPWQIDATLKLETTPQCRLRRLGTEGQAMPLARGEEHHQWNVTLQPYDLVAARLTEGEVRLVGLDFELPEESRAQLSAQIEDLGARAAGLSRQAKYDVLANPGFEEADGGSGIAGWSLLDPAAEVQVTQDRERARSGSASVRLASQAQVASLQSHLFPAPASGRLAVSAWLRVDDEQRQPVLRIALEGPEDGRIYYRFAQVGGDGAEGVRLTRQFKQFVFPIDDLPLEGLAQMRVRFDLIGAGTVWIDDVELFHLRFTKNERVELSKILVAASRALEAGQVADCLHLLEGYWPQFLAANVTPAQAAPIRTARVPERPAPPPPAEPSEEPGMLDRIREYVPSFLRFY